VTSILLFTLLTPFQNSVTNLIAHQTLLMGDSTAALQKDIAEMRESMALHKDVVEMQVSMDKKSKSPRTFLSIYIQPILVVGAKDALKKLAYVNACGNQHEACAEGTRVDIFLPMDIISHQDRVTGRCGLGIPASVQYLVVSTPSTCVSKFS
jgi:hypothetical protein